MRKNGTKLISFAVCAIMAVEMTLGYGMPVYATEKEITEISSEGESSEVVSEEESREEALGEESSEVVSEEETPEEFSEAETSEVISDDISSEEETQEVISEEESSETVNILDEMAAKCEEVDTSLENRLGIEDSIEKEVLSSIASIEVSEEVLGELQEVVLNEQNFPDYNFLYTIRMEFDKNADGVLDEKELKNTTYFIEDELNSVQDLKGIELLPSLVLIDVNFRGMKADFSQNHLLRYVDLSAKNNNDSGAEVIFPTNSTIKWLNLSGMKVNNISDSNLTQLEYLNIDRTGITSINLNSFTKLKYLSLNGSMVRDLELDSLLSLEYLDCGTCRINNVDLSKAANLKWINLDGNQSFTDLGALCLTNLNKLVYLSLNNCNLSSLNVSGCTDLVYLSCTNGPINNINLGNNTALSMLYLNSTEITALDLSSMSNLCELNVSDTELLALDVSANSKLMSLECSCTKAISNNRIEKLVLGKNPCLEYLNCDFQEIEVLNLKGCTSLRTISCYNCQIETLDFSKCKKIEAIIAVCNCELKKLNLNGCKQLKYLFIQESQSLSSLSLSGCSELENLQLSSALIKSLDTSSCKKLSTLSLIECKKLTSIKLGNQKYLTSLEVTASGLGKIDISKCSNLKKISCGRTKLSQLDVSKNKALQEIIADSTLTLMVADESCYAYRYAVENGNNVVITTKGISATLDKTQLEVGKYVVLNVTKIPSTLEVKGKLTFSSSNINVAQVSEEGKVTGIKAGKAVITAKLDKYKATCPIEVICPGVQYSLPSVLHFYDIGTVQLNLKISPVNATTADLTWASDNCKVASVSNSGLLQLKSNGFANIRVNKKGIGNVICNTTVFVHGAQVTYDYDNGDSKKTVYAPIGLLKEPVQPIKAGYRFLGWKYDNKYWNFKTDRLIDGKTISLKAQWESTNEVFIVDSIQNTVYSGSMIKPLPVVHYGNVVLSPGKDYSVSYKNNTNAGTATMIVKGKGNYKGTVQKDFVIEPAMISDMSATCPELLKVNGSVQKPMPRLQYNHIKLKLNVDYTVSYPSEGNYTDVGEYMVKVDGKGNYQGSRIMRYMLTDKKLISECKFKLSATEIPYNNGTAIEPEVEVKLKKDILVKDTDYTVTYESNTEVGTAIAVVVGKGQYMGVTRIPFKIMGIALSKFTITGVKDCEFTGDKVFLSGLSLELGEDILSETTDYDISYENNQKVGTAAVIFIGKGKYEGTVKKKFKIKPYNLGNDSLKLLQGDKNITGFLKKSGAKPDLALYLGNYEMLEGRDYTITCKNNKKKTDEFTDKGTFTVKGKGNFTGSITRDFTILEDSAKSRIMVKAEDVPYQDKISNFIPKLSVTDKEGRKQKEGTNYRRNNVYYLVDGQTGLKIRRVYMGEKLPSGSYLCLEVYCMDADYSPICESNIYHIGSESINNAKVNITPQDYEGQEVTLTPQDIMVMFENTELIYGEDYVITSYSGNNKAGTATVTIAGINNYMMEKKVKFAINQGSLDIY